MDALLSFVNKEENEGKKQVLQALKALRDGGKPNVVATNLRGLDREIADVVNEIIIRQQECAAEMVRAAEGVSEGKPTRVKLDNMYGTWLDIVGSMDKILQVQEGQIKHISDSLKGVVHNSDISNVAEFRHAVDCVALMHLQARGRQPFYAAFGHEIRTPLNGIIGITEIMLDSELNQEHHEYCTLIRNCGLSLITLVNDLLDAQRLHYDIDFRVRTESFKLRQTCELAMPSTFCKYPNHVFNIDIDPQIPNSLIGDVNHFCDRFIGRIEYWHAGEVLVAIKQEAIEGENITIAFSVTDHGTVYPEEKLRSIISGNLDDYNYSSNFDLPIALRLLKMVGGRAYAKSDKETGNTFTFTIPFKLDLHAQGELAPAHLAQRELLVVSAHAETQHVLARTITGLGMKPIGASNSEEAVEILQRSSDSTFVAVLIDGDVKENEELKTTAKKYAPVLVMSKSSAFQNDGLEKPVGPYNLLKAITSILEKPKTLIQHADYKGESINKQGKILGAIQNSVNRKVLERMLAKYGVAKTTLVENGLEALSEIDKDTYDVILLDLADDTFNITQAIRARELPNKRIPIIGIFRDDRREECLSKGMDGFLIKPISISALKSVLTQVLPAIPTTHSASNNNNEETDFDDAEFVVVGDE